MIIHNPILTGSFTVNGTDVASITGSAASITALNAYTASQDIRNGTYTLTSSFAAQTASFTAFTSSVNTFTASQLVLNGTYATTGSNTFAGIQTVNSNLVVTGSITAQTLVVQTVTSSVVYSSGSNVFGNNVANTQVFTGSMNLTGSLTVVTTGTEFQVTSTGVRIGNVIGDAHNITGSVGISGSLTGVAATFSGQVDGTIINSTSNAFRFSGNNAISLVSLNSQNVIKINAAGYWGVQLVGANDQGILINNTGAIGIKVTPSAWGSNMSSLQIGTGGVLNNFTGANNNFGVGVNFYDNGAGSQLRIYTGGTSKIDFSEDAILFSNATSNSAGTTISFNERMRIFGSGDIRINFNPGGGNGLYFNDTTSNAVMFYIVPAIFVGSSPYNRNRFIAANSSNISFETSVAERMRIGTLGFTASTTAASDASSKTFMNELNTDCGIIPIPAGSTLYCYNRSGGTNYRALISTSTYFTGQHGNKPINSDLKTNIQNYIGLIVSSAGTFYSVNPVTQEVTTGKDAIQISEALPEIKLTDTDQDKAVWGVVTNVKNDNYNTDGTVETDNNTEWTDRLGSNVVRVNGLGEGAIWVTNINGNIENGDYICSSTIPGYGRKQNDDLLHNYTVAKSTMDCDFDLNNDGLYVCKEFEFEGQIYKKAFIGCTYHCS